MDSPNPFHTPNNTRKHSHFGTSSSSASSTSPIEPDAISPRHPSDVYLTANTPLLVAAVIEKLKTEINILKNKIVGMGVHQDTRFKEYMQIIQDMEDEKNKLQGELKFFKD